MALMLFNNSLYTPGRLCGIRESFRDSLHPQTKRDGLGKSRWFNGKLDNWWVRGADSPLIRS